MTAPSLPASSRRVTGTDTLIASTNAVESSAAGDATYVRVNRSLAALEVARDQLAGAIKGELEAAAFSDTPVPGAAGQIAACHALIGSAAQLAAHS